MVWSSVIGGGLGLLNGIFGNYAADKRQQRQNEWQAQQDAINRNFQSREAEMAREWQEDMYLNYMSPEAQISSQMSGYKANGINPALMYGGSGPGASSMPSTSTPQGGVSSVSNQGNPYSGLANDILQGISIATQIRQGMQHTELLKQQVRIQEVEALMADFTAEELNGLKAEIKTTIGNDILSALQESRNRNEKANNEEIRISSERLNLEAEDVAKKLLIENPLSSFDNYENFQKTFANSSFYNEFYSNNNLIWKYIKEFKSQLTEYELKEEELTQAQVESFFSERRKEIANDTGIDINSPLSTQVVAEFRDIDDVLNLSDDEGNSFLDYLALLAFVPGAPGMLGKLTKLLGSSKLAQNVISLVKKNAPKLQKIFKFRK